MNVSTENDYDKSNNEIKKENSHRSKSKKPDVE